MLIVTIYNDTHGEISDDKAIDIVKVVDGVEVQRRDMPNWGERASYVISPLGGSEFYAIVPAGVSLWPKL